MSQNTLSTSLTSCPTSSFHTIFCDALKRYRDKTKSDLFTHPLTTDLQNCNFPSEFLAVLNRKYNVQGFIQSRRDNQTSTQWLNATFTVIASFSGVVGEGVGLVFSPGKIIFAGIGVLLIAARDVGANNDALVDILARIESSFERLEIYTQVPPTDAMKELIVRIMVEVLEVLAVATKWIKQKFPKKFLKKLVGRTDIEDAVTKLDRLTQEEALMGSAASLEIQRSVDKKADVVIHGVNQARVAIQHIENGLDGLNRGQLRKDFQKWLSPPDPSINLNTARKVYHKGTAEWFIQGNTFRRWKSEGSESMLWIHGKPGSGKSILSSAIIEDLKTISDSTTSYLVYFFFDFKDVAKQDNRSLLSSLLIQLSSQSNPCFKILLDVYSKHDDGSNQPTEGSLLQCLKDMLMNLGQIPVYLIIDAVDECPNTSKVLGARRSRREVLEAVKELVKLHLPNLHICITSRPEADIQYAVKHFARLIVSLHEQDGQKEDIAMYVRSVVYSDDEEAMDKWGRRLKGRVVEELSSKADGMFRWVVCQLDALRECLARNVPRVLSQLPKSLDETYQRILQGINEANRDDVYRLLQCLVVSMRPLSVEELAEVLAVDFEGHGENPKLNPDWRWEDQGQALQVACSSLITIVDTNHSRVVQFSHFSVKEFLTSSRLAVLCGDVSCYHISLGPAHAILAQTCMGVLLQLDDGAPEERIKKSLPMARYAAQYWVSHVQFDNVSSHTQKGMEELFDLDKPHFVAWVRLHNIDTSVPRDVFNRIFVDVIQPITVSTPLYYASLCGFHDLAKCLITKRPLHVNQFGGRRGTPLVAALERGDFQMADLLFRNGADVDVRGWNDKTPLFCASYTGFTEIVRWLLNHGADANIQASGWTSLHAAALCGKLEVARILLDHNAENKAHHSSGSTPLHLASVSGHDDLVRLLVGHGVDVNARDNGHSTPLHLASGKVKKGSMMPFFSRFAMPSLEVVQVLLEHGADVEAKDEKGRTAFNIASLKRQYRDIAKLLSEYPSHSTLPSDTASSR